MSNFDNIFTARGYAKRSICRRRVSVCLSVTLRYCIKTAKRTITQTTPHDILPWLWFSDAKDHGEIRTGSPPTGTTNAGGVG